MRRLLFFARFSCFIFGLSFLCPAHAQDYGAAPANDNPPPVVAPVYKAPQVAPDNAPVDDALPDNAVPDNTHPDNDQAPDTAPAVAPDQNPLAQKRIPRRNQVEMRLRVMMSDFGLDDPTKQDALIAYLAEDEAGKMKVRDAARRLLGAVKVGVSQERMRDLIAVYKGALDADHERRVAAQTALDAKIGYTLNPNLEAVLWLFGVLGEGQGGLPLNVLMPRMAPPRNTVNATVGMGTGALPARAGTVFGTVTCKGEGWLEVKSDDGITERYMPFWAVEKNAATGYDRSVLDAIENLKIGDKVRLEWVWSERKRVVKIENWVPAPLLTPIAPNDAPPAPIAP